MSHDKRHAASDNALTICSRRQLEQGALQAAVFLRLKYVLIVSRGTRHAASDNALTICSQCQLDQGALQGATHVRLKCVFGRHAASGNALANSTLMMPPRMMHTESNSISMRPSIGLAVTWWLLM